MKQEYSAGGIVLKKDPSTHSDNSGQAGSGQVKDTVYVLMAQHGQYHGWGFPKGLIGDMLENESKVDTAVREVKEETGIDAKIIDFACEETYWYKWQNEKRKKTVYYYIMKHLGGDFADKDHEMEAVEWVKLDEVEERLTYRHAKKMFREILPKIERLSESL